MYSVISISSKLENQQVIKRTILSHGNQYRLRGQFSICIDVLSIAPELKPDIIIVQEQMYFVGLRNFIRILTENGVHAVYILLKDEASDLPQYQNSRICARLEEGKLTEEVLLDALKLAEAKLQSQTDGMLLGFMHQNQEYYSHLAESWFFARIIGGQLTESDYDSPLIQCQKGYLVIARVRFKKNKSYHSIEQMNHLHQMMKLYLEIYGGGNVFTIQTNELCIWFDPPFHNDSQVMRAIQEIGRQLQKENPLKGDSQYVLQCTDKRVTLEELPVKYRAVDKIVRYHFFLEENTVVSEKYLQEHTVDVSYQEIQERFDALEQSYTEADLDVFLTQLDSLFHLAAQGLSFNTYFYIWNQLIFWYNLKVQQSRLSVTEYAFMHDNREFYSIKEARSEVKHIMKKMFDASMRKKSSYHSYVESAIAYLRENVSEDVSLTTVADVLHVNAAYLSALFRQETKKTFVQVRSEIKMEYAKELLREKRKIYEVAQAVGFENEKYFSRAFKKVAGVTPREFQSRESRG